MQNQQAKKNKNVTARRQIINVGVAAPFRFTCVVYSPERRREERENRKGKKRSRFFFF
jgi:hypothetical protein